MSQARLALLALWFPTKHENISRERNATSNSGEFNGKLNL
jgi:hypothetical protein